MFNLCRPMGNGSLSKNKAGSHKMNRNLKQIIMKTTILVLCTVTAICITSVYAHGQINVSEKILSSFHSDFSAAENAVWSDYGEYLQVRFNLSGVGTLAYYGNDGEFWGSERSISFNQLPMAVIREFTKSYTEKNVLAVSEVTIFDNTHYTIWLETDKKKIKLSATPSGMISIEKRLKK